MERTDVMTYKLCTAEKPSVAKDIARVIGAKEKHRGYYQGNGYIVTWAVGHLVELAEPEAYGFVEQSEIYSDDAAREKAYAELPLLPKEFKLVVKEETREQFEIIKALMHRDDVSEIIDCGDMGAEGHILQWFIREVAGNTKPVRRFCAMSMTDEAISEAMAHLRDADEFIPIIRGELCKKKEDWILGMSLSRALSIKYRAGISVGRVQSPTLGFVVKRYLDVMRFKPTDYFTMTAAVAGGIRVYWKKDTEGMFPPAAKTADGRVIDRAAIDVRRAEVISTGCGKVSAVSIAEKAEDRPQLYDITELQRDANRKYGYSAAVTLATAQALYETQKILSYPRTDSRYITSDLAPYMSGRVEEIVTLEKYAAAAKDVLAAGLVLDKKIVDDGKVQDHHAIIPTAQIKGYDFSKLLPTEKEAKQGVTAETMMNVLDLVLTRMLVSFSKPYLYKATTIEVTFPNSLTFKAAGSTPVSMGWKAVAKALGDSGESEEEQDEETEQPLPERQEGQDVSVESCEVFAKKTTPPKLHTEATLLTAMENAGQQIENGEILKGKGIGTQATRAEIIKTLFDRGYIEAELKGKTPYLKPTKKGLKLISVLPPDLYSPKITADWESRIAALVEGTVQEEQIMREFEAYIKEKTEQIKASQKEVSFAQEKESFGECPWCGKPVYRYQEKNQRGKILLTRFYCSEKCDWSFSANDAVFAARLGRPLKEREALQMIEKKGAVLTCTSQKNGAKYKGRFSFEERISGEKRYCRIVCNLV